MKEWRARTGSKERERRAMRARQRISWGESNLDAVMKALPTPKAITTDKMLAHISSFARD